ncbi:hypothetical protein POM88_053899 [Heracleum sosnowskyi]|uniref:PGG domain-containing protein n=1 Tax=Heracleum sosnowskyi TaxID=360622 RepID=A0AAD8GP50_9APIA|nr:hypothetical protein POM88_053899 [Heracleum sosnowskyi]
MVMMKKFEKYSIFQKAEEKKDEHLLIAASVIAAIAYSAAISPPGGIASVDAGKPPAFAPNSLKPSESLLGYFDSNLSDRFWIFNTISLLTSLSVIFFYVSGLSLKRKFQVWLMRVAMWITISSMAIAYVFAVRATNPSTHKDTQKTLNIGVIAWGIMLFVTYACAWVNWIWTRDDQVEAAARHTDNIV